MSHFVGKLVLNSLLNTKIMEVEQDNITEKGIFIPFKDNGIVLYNDEIQLWFRAFSYRNNKSRFTHFLMKFIPRKDIRRMSAAQIEAFANHQIGGLIKTSNDTTIKTSEINTNDFISQNI